MAYATFILHTGVNASPGSSEDFEPRVLSAEFGDGYTQRSLDGINALKTVFTFQAQVLNRTESKTILDFFRSKKGCIPFVWTRPGETLPQQWICRKWGRTWTGPMSCDVTAALEEDFSPVV